MHTGCGKNDASGLTASGVPGNIVLSNRLFEVEKELTNLKIVVDNSSVSVVKSSDEPYGRYARQSYCKNT